MPITSVRPATPDDAEHIVHIWSAIVEERTFSAVDAPFSVEAERAYLRGLSNRERLFVSEVVGTQQIVGFQSLDLWTKLFHSMDHVGQLGTFVMREWRGKGIGAQLAKQTLSFARSAGYEKLVVFVRAGNTTAQAFYASLGFRECGRLQKQVTLFGNYEDEVLMEVFL